MEAVYCLLSTQLRSKYQKINASRNIKKNPKKQRFQPQSTLEGVHLVITYFYPAPYPKLNTVVILRESKSSHYNKLVFRRCPCKYEVKSLDVKLSQALVMA